MKIELEIPDNRVAALLCGAFEGGSNYWCRIEKLHRPKDGNLFAWDVGPTEPPFGHVQFPMSVGGSLTLRDTESEKGAAESTYVLNLDVIRNGLRVFASLKFGEGGHHFGDFMSENDDATTADVFLQCCVFGGIVYG